MGIELPRLTRELVRDPNTRAAVVEALVARHVYAWRPQPDGTWFDPSDGSTKHHIPAYTSLIDLSSEAAAAAVGALRRHRPDLRADPTLQAGLANRSRFTVRDNLTAEGQPDGTVTLAATSMVYVRCRKQDQPQWLCRLALLCIIEVNEEARIA